MNQCKFCGKSLQGLKDAKRRSYCSRECYLGIGLEDYRHRPWGTQIGIEGYRHRSCGTRFEYQSFADAKYGIRPGAVTEFGQIETDSVREGE